MLELDPTPAPITTEAGQRILDVAAELFYVRGINRTGVDLLADRAGVTKRTLYQRFGSKELLVAAYLQQRAHRWQSGLMAALRNCEPGSAALEALYAFAQEWVGSNRRGCAFVNAWVEVGDEAHPGLSVIQAEKAWMRTLFHWMAPGPHAEALYLLYEGAQVSASLQQSAAPFATALTASKRLL